MVSEYVVRTEGERRRLVINCRGWTTGPDVARYAEAMRKVIEILQQVEADEIVLQEYYERIYNEEQTRMLKSIADMITRFETEGIWSPSHLGKTTESKIIGARHDAVLSILNLARSDPFGAYLNLLKEVKKETDKAAGLGGEALEDEKVYLGTLNFMKTAFEATLLVQKMKQYLAQLGSIPADRGMYSALFEVAIKPSFIGSRIFFTGTETMELVDQYEVVGTKIYIYKHPEKVEFLYFINPPEYTLPPDKYFLLEKTKEVVAGHRPEAVGFMDMAQARRYFHKIYVATIADLAMKNNIPLSIEEKEELATIVARYTIGYGILEILLSDRQLTDVYIDSPLGYKAIYLVHSKYGQCQTNIIFSDEEARAIVSRFRALSGRPFDEAHPILDFDLVDLQTRVCVIGKPLAVDGTAFALRLHKETPWTLAQFLDVKMFNPLAAGMFSFFVDAQASMLIVGSRGSGKCLDGDSLVQLADGRLARIKDIVDNEFEKAKEIVDVGDGACVECGEDLWIFTMTPDLKVIKARVERVWRRTSPPEMIEIHLASGKEVTVTPEHPFFVIENGFVTQKRADGLNENEFIATPRVFQVENTQPFPVIALTPSLKMVGCVSGAQNDLNELNDSIELKQNASKIGLKYKTLLTLKQGVRKAVYFDEAQKISAFAGKPVERYLNEFSGVAINNSSHSISLRGFSGALDAAYARFLGLLLGDGHVDGKKIEFTNTDSDLLNEFKELSGKIFGVRGRFIYSANRSPNYQLVSRSLSRLLRDRFGIVLGNKASSQTIPEEILKGTDDILAAFISAYFDCNASVHLGRGEIEFCTASKSMAEQLQYTLTRFGIASIRKKKVVKGKCYYCLFIKGENCLVFQQKIGFRKKDKREKLSTMLSGRKFNSNTDVIPNAWALLRYTRNNYGVGKLGLDQKNLGRKKLQRISAKLLLLNTNDEIIKQAYNLAHSDLFWDRVTSVKRIKPKEPFVYDLTVSGTHSFVANGIIVHNTSFLQALMQEIPQNLRIIVQEDSVTADARMIVERDGKMESTTAGELVDGLMREYGCEEIFGKHVLRTNPDGVKVFAYNPSNGKIGPLTVTQFIRHRVTKPIYEVVTRSGKKIRVTADHSLFTLGETGVEPVKTSKIRPGDFIATPRKLPLPEPSTPVVFNALGRLESGFVEGNALRQWMRANAGIVRSVGRRLGYSKATAQNWLRRGLLPVEAFKSLGIPVEAQQNLLFKIDKKSKPFPCEFVLDEDFATFTGLWLADGCYDSKYAVILSVDDEESRAVVKRVAEKFGLRGRVHSDGVSLIISNTNFNWLCKNVAGLRGDAYTKKMPEWVWNSTVKQRAAVLRGLFSGGGNVAKAEVQLDLCSFQLIKDVESLLLSFGIFSRVHDIPRDKTKRLTISALKMQRMFSDNIGFLQPAKRARLERLCSKKSSHDITDIIPFSAGMKTWLCSELALNKHDYLKRGFAVGREKLLAASAVADSGGTASAVAYLLSTNDLHWDEVKSTRIVETGECFVYDFSVPGCENFVCENVVAHNTQEIPVPSLKRLGFNIERLKTRPPLGGVGEGEVSAEDALRTALRLGDSVLIVGEVRSSVRGSEEVLVVENGVAKRIPIKDLEGKPVDGVQVPTLDFDLKFGLKPLAGFVKHGERDRLVEIRTRSGRRVTVTPDHSLFTATRDFRIAAIECSKLAAGDQVVIPSRIPCGFNDLNEIRVMEWLHGFRLENFEEPVRAAIAKIGWRTAAKIACVTSGDVYNYFRNSPSQQVNMPIEAFENLMNETRTSFEEKAVKVRRGTSTSLPAVIPVNEEFCRFLGYYVSEGHHSMERGSGGSVILTNSDETILSDMKHLSNSLFGINPVERVVHGAGALVQLQISSAPLAALVEKLGCGRICTEKRVPPIVYGLSKKKIAAFLRALYSCDGSFTASRNSTNAVRFFSTSKKLAEDVAYLLLVFGIVARVYSRKSRGEKSNDLWIVEFKDRGMVETFLNEIGFVHKKPVPLAKAWAHTKSNTVYFDKKSLQKHLKKYPRKYGHLFRFGRCSKNYLKKVVSDAACECSDELKAFALGDFYLDDVVSVKEIVLEKPEPVYDLSVSPSQNFVGGFGGILLHNTEAKALYEAMRVGAVGNVVMGTIHGESAYSIWDRVVNDLGVPTTSFKATDFALVSAPIRFKGSLKRQRRVIEVTEVKKHWTTDPGKEGGFLQWMQFDATKDDLELFEDNLKESEWLERIKRTRGLKFEDIWNEINARAAAKQYLVEMKRAHDIPRLLEAEQTVRAHVKYLLMAEKQREELGKVDHKSLLEEWRNWVDNVLVKEQLQMKKLA